MKIISIGDKVPQGTFQIHSRFDRVINFINNDNIVSLVDKEIGGGPLHIVIKNVNLNDIHSLEIRQQSIVLNHVEIGFREDQYFNSSIDFKHLNVDTFQKNLIIFEKLLIEISHPKSLAFLLDETRINYFHSEFDKAFVKQISIGVHLIYNGDLLNGVKMLRGCGFGLTPSGDDFICGLLIGLNFIRELFGKDISNLINSIYKVSKGENIFSNTFLKLARDGLLFERMKKLLAAILCGGENEIRQCMKRLYSVGESSGADLCTGFLLTVKSEI